MTEETKKKRHYYKNREVEVLPETKSPYLHIRHKDDQVVEQVRRYDVTDHIVHDTTPVEVKVEPKVEVKKVEQHSTKMETRKVDPIKGDVAKDRAVYQNKFK